MFQLNKYNKIIYIQNGKAPSFKNDIVTVVPDENDSVARKFLRQVPGFEQYLINHIDISWIDRLKNIYRHRKTKLERKIKREITKINNMKYSMKEITSSLTKKKNSRSSLWVQLWVRKASFPVTYLFINAGWSANMVSVLSWILIFFAAVCLCVNNFWWMLAGVLLTNFWLVLDCVDGNIARVKKVKTFMGDFFDAVAGYGPFSFTTLALGIAAYNTSFFVSDEHRIWLIVLGGFGAMCNLYMRLVHQKYLNCYFAAEKILGETDRISLKDTEDKKSFAYIREQIDKNLGVSGLFMPWLIVALFTNTFDIMVVFYTLYYLVSFVAISYLYSVKASKYEIEAQAKMKQMNVDNN